MGVLSEPSSKADIFLQMEAVLHLNDTTLAISGSYSKGKFFTSRIMTMKRANHVCQMNILLRLTWAISLSKKSARSLTK